MNTADEIPDMWEILERHGLKPRRNGKRIRALCPWCIEAGISTKKQGTLVASGTVETSPFKCFRCDTTGNVYTICKHYGDPEHQRREDLFREIANRPTRASRPARKPAPQVQPDATQDGQDGSPASAASAVGAVADAIAIAGARNGDAQAPEGEEDFADWELNARTAAEMLAGLDPADYRRRAVEDAIAALKEDAATIKRAAAAKRKAAITQESTVEKAWRQIVAAANDDDFERVRRWAAESRGWPTAVADAICVLDDVAAPTADEVDGPQGKAIVRGAERIDRPLLIAIRCAAGRVRQISRRWIATGSPTDARGKAMALSADTAGNSDAWGGVWCYGSIPDAVDAAKAGDPIYIVEGAPDYLAMRGVIDAAGLAGVALGFYSTSTAVKMASALVKALGDADVIAPKIVVVPNVDQPREVNGVLPEHGIGLTRAIEAAEILRGRAGVHLALIPLRDGHKTADLADLLAREGLRGVMGVLNLATCHRRAPVHVDQAAERIKTRFADAITDATTFKAKDGKRRRLVILQIDPGAGKSWAALRSVADIASGATNIPVNGRKPRTDDEDEAIAWPPEQRSVIFACQTHQLAEQMVETLEHQAPGTPANHIHGLLHHCEFEGHVGEIFPSVGRAGICGRAGTKDRCERAEWCPGAQEPSAPRGIVTFCAHALLPSLKADLVVIDEAAMIEDIAGGDMAGGGRTGVSRDAVASLFRSNSLPRTKVWTSRSNPEAATAARLLVDKIGPIANQHAADVSAGRASNFSLYIDGDELRDLIGSDDVLRGELIMGFGAKRRSSPPAPTPAEARKGGHGHRYMPSRTAFGAMVGLAEWAIRQGGWESEYAKAAAFVANERANIDEERRRKRQGKRSRKKTVVDEFKAERAKAEAKKKRGAVIDPNQVALPIIGQDVPAITDEEQEILEGDADGAFSFITPRKASKAKKASSRVKPTASIRIDPDGNWSVEIRRVRPLPDAPIVMLDATGHLVEEEYRRAYPDRDVVVKALSVQGSAPAKAVHYESRSFSRRALIEDHGLRFRPGAVERIRRVTAEFCLSVEEQLRAARDEAGGEDGEEAETVKPHIAILTHKPIADAMILGLDDKVRVKGEAAERFYALTEAIRERGFTVDVGWFGNHDRGINAWQGVDGMLVIGDPTSNLGAARQYAKLIDMDPDAISRNRTEATCQQAIARSRSIRRGQANRVVLGFAGSTAPSAPGVVWERVDLSPGPLPATVDGDGNPSKQRAHDMAEIAHAVAEQLGMIGVAVVQAVDPAVAPWRDADLTSANAVKALARAVDKEARARGWGRYAVRLRDGAGRPATVYSFSGAIAEAWAGTMREVQGG